MDFSKVILMTDLDGTLLDNDRHISEKNIAAINRFRAGGGKFSFATGRGVAMTEGFAAQLNLDMPAVINNGAAVYDFIGHKFLWSSEIGSCALPYIQRIREAFPDIGMEILRGDIVYAPLLNDTERWHLEIGSVTPNYTPLSDIPPDGWMKMLFAHTPEKTDELVEFVRENDLSGAQWVRSAPVFYECLPKGVDKSVGFAKLIELCGCGDRFTAAAGDYNNDIAMIKSANLGAAVASAQPEVKSAADIIVCDNNSGAISEIIDHIERL